MVLEADSSQRGGMSTTDKVLVALRRIIRTIDLHSRSLVQRFGLTGPQLAVLKALADRDQPPSISHLAAAVHVSHATVTGICHRLEARGLVARQRSGADRRRVTVQLTPLGESLLAEAPPRLQEHFTARFAQARDWEQFQILASLLRLGEMMEAGQRDAAPLLAEQPGQADGSEAQAF